MITWIEVYLAEDDTKLLLILSLIAVSNIIDFVLGWTFAKLNPKINFSTSTAIMGIARKITLLILLIMFIPFSLMLPEILGLGTLYVLYIGYLVTEFLSILGHIGVTTDSNDGIFHDFLTKVFSGKVGKE